MQCMSRKVQTNVQSSFLDENDAIHGRAVCQLRRGRMEEHEYRHQRDRTTLCGG
jgi:hypothetical protein